MKLAIITGADGGMGYEETKAVALKGYHTIMACYCPKRAEEKCAKLIQETGNSNIEIIGIDLANLASVRQFAEKVKSRFQRVDLLMNNAGTMETGYHYTVDGLERTISVNYVGPYLLSRLLLPLMGKGSRIVNMASLVYPLGRLNFPQFFERGNDIGIGQIFLCVTQHVPMFIIAALEKLACRRKVPGTFITEVFFPAAPRQNFFLKNRVPNALCVRDAVCCVTC